MSRLVFILLILSFLFGCKSSDSRSQREEATYQEILAPEPSVIRIPLHLEIAELEKLIEQQSENLRFSGAASGDERLEIAISKAAQAIKIEVFNEQIRYRVPLRLDIAYDVGLAKPRAKGVLELDFRSGFSIDSAWRLTTQTQLNSYNWLEEPKLSLGGFSLPLTTIGNYAVRQAESSLERGIDEAVEREIALQDYVTEAWKLLQQPLLVSPEDQAWLLIRPISLQMSPLSSTEKAISAEIRLEAEPRLTFSAYTPVEPLRPIPAFSYAQADNAADNFNLHLGASISYLEAERMAAVSVVGETFSSGARSIRVNDMKLFGQDGKLMVEVATTGSYNGKIFLSGLPEYDKNRGRLSIRDLDFTLKTKSFLTKTASWLLKGPLKRQLQNNLNELLTDNLNEVRDQLEAQLEQQELAPGIAFNGQLNELGLAATYLTKDGIEVVVDLSGIINLNISGLTQLLSNE